MGNSRPMQHWLFWHCYMLISILCSQSIEMASFIPNPHLVPFIRNGLLLFHGQLVNFPWDNKNLLVMLTMTQLMILIFFQWENEFKNSKNYELKWWFFLHVEQFAESYSPVLDNVALQVDKIVQKILQKLILSVS